MGAEKKIGGRKSYLAAEHHNEAAPKRKEKKPRFFRLGAEKYDFRAPKEQRPNNRKRSDKNPLQIVLTPTDRLPVRYITVK